VTASIDETHHAELRSWVETANATTTDFPIQNLPLGVFRRGEGTPRPGVAIGDQVLDLAAANELKLVDTAMGSLIDAATGAAALNPLLDAGPEALRALRATVSALLRDDTTPGRNARRLAETLLVPAADAEALVPVRIGDYTDFYSSIHHATNVGSMFRPDNPLLPNYKWVPIGYHGRASSIVPSGQRVARPSGQTVPDSGGTPQFGPTRRLDYELEIGVVIGRGNPLGSAIPIASAESHMAGLCLVNDWSARDIQSWEYQPLGPFLAKSFTTTVSPWIVTMDALAPFRVPLADRPPGDPDPLPYLSDPADRAAGGFAIELSVSLTSARMRSERREPYRVSVGRFAESIYWTPAQLIAHHTSNGCNLRPGDLLATGTVSGSSPESRGCLLERTWRGSEPLTLPTGETRRFLEDGDEVVMRARCERAGFRAIGFGECRGIVAGATPA
jgi:fumarylacetoacetase